MLLASIDPKCDLKVTAVALRTEYADELKWKYVATTLIDEYNVKLISRAASESRRSRQGRRRNPRKIFQAFI